MANVSELSVRDSNCLDDYPCASKGAHLCCHMAGRLYCGVNATAEVQPFDLWWEPFDDFHRDLPAGCPKAAGKRQRSWT